MNPLIVLTPIRLFHPGGSPAGNENEQDLRRIGTNDNEYYALLESEPFKESSSLKDLERLLAFAKRHDLLAYRKDRSTLITVGDMVVC